MMNKDKIQELKRLSIAYNISLIYDYVPYLMDTDIEEVRMEIETRGLSNDDLFDIIEEYAGHSESNLSDYIIAATNKLIWEL